MWGMQFYFDGCAGSRRRSHHGGFRDTSSRDWKDRRERDGGIQGGRTMQTVLKYHGLTRGNLLRSGVQKLRGKISPQHTGLQRIYSLSKGVGICRNFHSM